MKTTNNSTSTRLNKFISHNSKYSRREADTLISSGKVTINGKRVDKLSTTVNKSDEVKILKQVIKEDKNRVYTVIIYNKPKGELVTKNDPKGRKTIFDSLDKKFKHYTPIGRLDYSSEGLILLTDSVDIVNALMHSTLERVYKIKVQGQILRNIEDAMRNGLILEDAKAGAHKNSTIQSMNFAPFLGYDILTNKDTFSKIKVAISEGKNRELRRFFSHFDLDILDLKRLSYGGISLNNLPTGKSRFLSKSEYKDLRDYLKLND